MSDKKTKKELDIALITKLNDLKTKYVKTHQIVKK